MDAPVHGNEEGIQILMTDGTPNLLAYLQGRQLAAGEEVPHVGRVTAQDGSHLVQGVAGGGDDPGVVKRCF
jgi:hypothetical protein